MELQNVIDEFNKIIDSLQLDWGENGYKVNVLKGEKRASIYFFDTKIGELSYRGRGKNILGSQLSYISQIPAVRTIVEGFNS